MPARGHFGSGLKLLPAIALASATLGTAQVAAPRAVSAAGATPSPVLIVDSGVDGCTRTFCYEPGLLSVSRGTQVLWANASAAPHTVTRCTLAACGVSGGTGTGSLPASGTLLPGQTYSTTFNGSGTCVYYCKIHGYAVMHATVKVT
jgi:plastocyanin